MIIRVLFTSCLICQTIFGQVMLRGGASFSGPLSAGPVKVAPVTVDMVQTFQEVNTSELVTDSALNIGQVGTSVTWAYVGTGTGYNTIYGIDGPNLALKSPVVAGGITFTNTGTRWLRVDHETSNLTPKGQHYDSTGSTNIPVVPNMPYVWRPKTADDVSAINGTDIYTNRNGEIFVSQTNFVTLTGTADALVTAHLLKHYEYMALRLPGGAGGSFKYLKVTAFFHFGETNATTAQVNLDLMIMVGNPYAVFQINLNQEGTDTTGRVHVQGPFDGLTVEHIEGKTIEAVLIGDYDVGTGALYLYDVDNNYALLGSSSSAFGVISGNAWQLSFPVNYIDDGLGGYTDLGFVTATWTNTDPSP